MGPNTLKFHLCLGKDNSNGNEETKVLIQFQNVT